MWPIRVAAVLQATGGGGGIGIYICRSHEEVVAQYSVASRQGKANFGDAGAGCCLCSDCSAFGLHKACNIETRDMREQH